MAQVKNISLLDVVGQILDLLLRRNKMNSGKVVSRILLTSMVLFLASCAEQKAPRSRSYTQQVGALDSIRIKKLFAHPPRRFSSAPLWVWNDMLTEDQIVSTMHDLAGQNVKQVFVHPRPL